MRTGCLAAGMLIWGLALALSAVLVRIANSNAEPMAVAFVRATFRSRRPIGRPAGSRHRKGSAAGYRQGRVVGRSTPPATGRREDRQKPKIPATVFGSSQKLDVADRHPGHL
jgi:hypothetical protein